MNQDQDSIDVLAALKNAGTTAAPKPGPAPKPNITLAQRNHGLDSTIV